MNSRPLIVVAIAKEATLDSECVSTLWRWIFFAVPPNLLGWVRRAGLDLGGQTQEIVLCKSCSIWTLCVHTASSAWAFSLTHVVDHNETTAGPSWWRDHTPLWPHRSPLCTLHLGRGLSHGFEVACHSRKKRVFERFDSAWPFQSLLWHCFIISPFLCAILNFVFSWTKTRFASLGSKECLISLWRNSRSIGPLGQQSSQS